MLRLHTKAIAELVKPAELAGDSAIEKVAAVKLQPWLTRENFHHPPARRLIDASHQTSLPEGFIDDPIMVVAFSESELFVVLVNPRTNGGRRAKIERRGLHGP